MIIDRLGSKYVSGATPLAIPVTGAHLKRNTLITLMKDGWGWQGLLVSSPPKKIEKKYFC